MGRGRLAVPDVRRASVKRSTQAGHVSHWWHAASRAVSPQPRAGGAVAANSDGDQGDGCMDTGRAENRTTLRLEGRAVDCSVQHCQWLMTIFEDFDATPTSRRLPEVKNQNLQVAFEGTAGRMTKNEVLSYRLLFMIQCVQSLCQSYNLSGPSIRVPHASNSRVPLTPFN